MSKVKITGDASGTGVFTIAAPGTNNPRTITLPDSTGTLLTSDGDGSSLTGVGVGKNIIINGGMRISQRNGTSVGTADGDSYKGLDRFKTRTYGGTGRYSVQQLSNDPVDQFNYCQKLIVTTPDTGTAYSYALAYIPEGYDVEHLLWGTTSSKTVTMSFWVKSSLTGTYCVSFRSQNADRSYVVEYTISSANTWEKKTMTLTGPTNGGTFPKNNTAGMLIEWCLNQFGGRTNTANTWHSANILSTTNQTNWIATNGATFFLTGVQLEVGSTATDYEHKSYGEELRDCQRYYEKVTTGSSGAPDSTASFVTMFQWGVVKRVTPGITQDGVLTVTNYGVYDRTQSAINVSINGSGRIDTMGAQLRFANFTSLTMDTSHGININNTFHLKVDAEI